MLENSPHHFTPGEIVQAIESYSGLDAGLEASVVVVDPNSGKIVVAPWPDEPTSVLISVEPSRLRPTSR